MTTIEQIDATSSSLNGFAQVIENLQKVLQEVKQLLEARNDEIGRLKAELAEVRATLDSERTTHVAKVSEVSGERDSLKASVANRETIISVHESTIARMHAEAREADEAQLRLMEQTDSFRVALEGIHREIARVLAANAPEPTEVTGTSSFQPSELRHPEMVA